LIPLDTPYSWQLKLDFSGISEGYQEKIADKVVSEKAYRQYQELVGGQKNKKTADRRKRTQVTVVTPATIIKPREKRDRIDAQKTSREACKLTKETTALSEVPGPALGVRKKKKLFITPGEPSVSMSTITEKEVESMSGQGLNMPLDDINWEDNDRDGSEYRHSIQVLSGGLEGLWVSGWLGGVRRLELNSRGGNLFIDSTMRQSERVSKSRA